MLRSTHSGRIFSHHHFTIFYDSLNVVKCPNTNFDAITARDCDYGKGLFTNYVFDRVDLDAAQKSLESERKRADGFTESLKSQVPMFQLSSISAIF